MVKIFQVWKKYTWLYIKFKMYGMYFLIILSPKHLQRPSFSTVWLSSTNIPGPKAIYLQQINKKIPNQNVLEPSGKGKMWFFSFYLSSFFLFHFTFLSSSIFFLPFSLRLYIWPNLQSVFARQRSHYGHGCSDST